MIEANIYAKIYDYAFKKTRNVWLTAENSWSSTGIWFNVRASISEKSFLAVLRFGGEEDHHLLLVLHQCLLK